MDYSKEEIGNHISIELEVANIDANNIQKQYPNAYPKSESSKIKEITNIHQLPLLDRQEIYKTIKNIYKDTFPIGWDTMLSGGVHFHAFMNRNMTGPEIASIPFKLNFIEYAHNFNALPLYCKANWMQFYRRPNCSIESYTESMWYRHYNMQRALLWIEPSLASGSRTSVGGWRKSFRTHWIDYDTFRSMEFRCNNITDTRIYGYYIGQLLLAEAGIKLEKLSKIVKQTENPNPSGIHITLSELQWTVYDSPEDQKKIRQNLQLLLVILRKNKFTKAAYNLRMYAKEMKII